MQKAAGMNPMGSTMSEVISGAPAWRWHPGGVCRCRSAHPTPHPPRPPAMAPASRHRPPAAIRSDHQPIVPPNPDRESCAAGPVDAPQRRQQAGGPFQAIDPCVAVGCPLSGNFAHVCPPYPDVTDDVDAVGVRVAIRSPRSPPLPTPERSRTCPSITPPDQPAHSAADSWRATGRRGAVHNTSGRLHGGHGGGTASDADNLDRRPTSAVAWPGRESCAAHSPENDAAMR